MVVKFLEQFALVMDAVDSSGFYDADEGFFYDRVIDASGNATSIEVQTLVGLIPALPAAVVPVADSERFARLRRRFARWVGRDGRPPEAWRVRRDGDTERVLVSMITPEQLRGVFTPVFDEDGFLSPYGLRSISRRHRTPYTVPGMPDAVIDYEPAESRTAMYGGNSNWRGPVWFPVNYVVIRALLQYDEFFGSDLTVEYPTGSGTHLTLGEIAGDLADRLIAIWLPDGDGRRPVYGGIERFQRDPAWRDNLQFHEYFHGDLGAGLGASHQTGWTALVVDLILDPPSSSSGGAGFRR
jgi:hypothetical protein